MNCFMGTVELLLCLPGIGLLAHRLLQPARQQIPVYLHYAAVPLAMAAVMYCEGILLGTFALLRPTPTVLLNLGLWLLLRRESAPLLTTLRQMQHDLQEGFASQPLLVAPILLPLLLALAAPLQDGDSLIYHLPNLYYFIQSGSTATFNPDYMYDATTATAYYPRGMEVMGALFWQFVPFATPLILFKYFLFLSFYFLAAQITKRLRLAAKLFVLLSVCFVVQNDLDSLKNDLLLALAVSYATIWVTERRAALPSAAGSELPFAIVVILCLALKTSGLFYAVPLILLWLVTSHNLSRGARSLLLSGILLVGGYFYWITWAQQGTPLYPFSLSVFGWHIFPGQPANLWHTTLTGNLDAGIFQLFLRGLLRQIGPLGCIVLGVAGAGLLRIIRRVRPLPKIDLFLLLYFSAVFLITPYSDTNTAQPHTQLFSGHSVRMALPVLLFLLLLIARQTSKGLDFASLRLNPALTDLLFPLLLLLNWLWYDFVCLVIKPENAFISHTFMLGSFDNLRLGLALLLLILMVVWICRQRYVFATVCLLVTACVVNVLQAPQNIGYLMRFKQINQPNAGAFFALQNLIQPHQRVILCCGATGSYYTGCMNQFLLPRVKSLKFMDPANAFNDADCVIACALDEEHDRNLGRKYQPSWKYLPTPFNPPAYICTWSNACYMVFARRN